MKSCSGFSGGSRTSILGINVEEFGFWTLRVEVFHFEGRVPETRLEVNHLC